MIDLQRKWCDPRKYEEEEEEEHVCEQSSLWYKI